MLEPKALCLQTMIIVLQDALGRSTQIICPHNIILCNTFKCMLKCNSQCKGKVLCKFYIQTEFKNTFNLLTSRGVLKPKPMSR